MKLGRSRRSQLLHPFLRVSGYGLRKVLDKVWELHVRLYDDGFIYSEGEARRKYLENLSDRRLNVVYEAYEYYRGVYDKLHT